MKTELELLELLLDTETSNMGVFRPIESYEAELKELDEDIERIKLRKENIEAEYNSRIEHHLLLAKIKEYIESLKTEKA